MAITEFRNYDLDNLPIIGEDFPIRIYARTRKGDFYDLSTATKVYCTFKNDLTAVDGSAPIQNNSVSNPTYFDLTKAASGEVVITVPYSMTDDLTAGTLYYIDVKALFSGSQRYLLRAKEVRFAQWVTRAQS